jgi:hypothetical protein
MYVNEFGGNANIDASTAAAAATTTNPIPANCRRPHISLPIPRVFL